MKRAANPLSTLVVFIFCYRCNPLIGKLPIRALTGLYPPKKYTKRSIDNHSQAAI